MVTSFGYLGFNNSKFGRIDAHIAVCAFARDILLKTSKVVETCGFEIIHGIVDSIWIRRRKKNIDIKTVNLDDKIIYENLKKEIENNTGFSISFEGLYKWIVFDSSKKDLDLPALNRYFGAFEDGTIKARGIELRRHDTPPLFSRFQNELLQYLSTKDNIDETVKSLLPSLEKIYKKYRDLLNDNKRSVHFSDLVFTKRISKNSDGYSFNDDSSSSNSNSNSRRKEKRKRKTIESCIVNILSDYGKSLSVGQEIRYIITDFNNKNPAKRAIPIELVEQDSNLVYDSARYCKLLDDCYTSIIKYFR